MTKTQRRAAEVSQHQQYKIADSLRAHMCIFTEHMYIQHTTIPHFKIKRFCRKNRQTFRKNNFLQNTHICNFF